MDDINIFIIDGKKYHENPALRNVRCIECGEDFRFKIHGNKLSFKKREMSYYKYHSQDNNIHYSHEFCLEKLIYKYTNNNYEMTINDENIELIELFDRFSKKLYKQNYIKNIKKILNGMCLAKFVERVRLSNLYNEKLHLGFHCTSYIFKGNNEEFNKIKEEHNQFWDSKGVSVGKNITPKYISTILNSKFS